MERQELLEAREDRIIKPALSQTRALIGGLIFLAVALLLGLAIWQIDFFLPALAFPLLLAILGSYILIALPSLRRREERRQAAAQGEPSLLAIEQRILDDEAFRFPITIQIKPNIAWQLLFSLLWIPIYFVCNSIGAVLHGDYRLALSGQDSLLAGVPLFLLQSAGLAGVLFLISILRNRERVEATPEGLFVSVETTPARTRSIQWDEVRLFALYGGKETGESIEYELSGPMTILCWRRLNQTRWRSWMKPALPFDEYDRQMEALLALIAAKTGLLLYDLRG
jgi:hypothetical protein